MLQSRPRLCLYNNDTLFSDWGKRPLARVMCRKRRSETGSSGSAWEYVIRLPWAPDCSDLGVHAVQRQSHTELSGVLDEELELVPPPVPRPPRSRKTDAAKKRLKGGLAKKGREVEDVDCLPSRCQFAALAALLHEVEICCGGCHLSPYNISEITNRNLIIEYITWPLLLPHKHIFAHTSAMQQYKLIRSST